MSESNTEVAAEVEAPTCKLEGIDHVYIIATDLEPDRYAYIRQWLDKTRFALGYVDVVCPTYRTNLTVHEVATHVKRKTATSGKVLTRGEISLAINHIACFHKACDAGFNTCLFLESDVLMPDSFVSDMNEVMRAIATQHADFDYLSIGNGCNLHAGEHYYGEANNGNRFGLGFYRRMTTRCTDSMVITTAALRKILIDLVPFNMPIDFALNEQIVRHNLQAYWLEPTIVTAGSCAGVYPSTIQ